MFIRKYDRDAPAPSAAAPPLASGTVPGAAVPGASRPEAAVPQATGPAGPRVLIVEDEWLIAAAAEAVLTEAACTVVGMAGTAGDALRLARLWRPDLVLMDIDLRGPRSGIDAAIDIRASLGIRSLFVTGRSDDATRRRAEAAHPLGWLIKPCVGGRLVAAVRAAHLSLSPSSAAPD